MCLGLQLLQQAAGWHCEANGSEPVSVSQHKVIFADAQGIKSSSLSFKGTLRVLTEEL